MGMVFAVGFFAPEQFRLAIELGTLGEWIAGIGTFVAAWVALRIAHKGQREANKQRRDRAQLLAWRLQKELVLTIRGLRRLRLGTGNFAVAAADMDDNSMQVMRARLGVYGMPYAEQEFYELSNLPDGLGVRIASCLAMIDLVEKALDAATRLPRGKRRPPILYARKQAKTLLPQLEAILSELTKIGNGSTSDRLE
jgi:hypothetical protein